MTFGQKLTRAMREAALKDEQVAVMIDKSAYQVAAYRNDRSEPRRATYDLMRRKIPGFASLMDSDLTDFGLALLSANSRIVFLADSEPT